ncbi:hypothetical protein [uncultured Acinetobacter sp.]|uniref:hypothetical protein n=1 Tax=uncultured Acinetobacter sp. TaxID=165433 RepID=UPI003748A10A
MNNTIYLIQTSFASTASALNKVQQVFVEGDQIVIMGEALSALTSENICSFQSYYCLNNERILLNPDLSSAIIPLDYSAFVDLVLQYKRSVSFK